jgi:hypothetical protein
MYFRYKPTLVVLNFFSDVIIAEIDENKPEKIAGFIRFKYKTFT